VKKFSAHYVFPLVSAPLKNGIIVIDDNGFIAELIDTGGQMPEISRLEFYNGILIPEIECLSVKELLKKQEQSPRLSLNELLKSFYGKTPAGFQPGQKASVFLIEPLDLLNLKFTGKSKLKKLV